MKSNTNIGRVRGLRLTSVRPNRTIIALGHLVLSCSIDLYGKLIDHLLECIQRKQDNSATRTYINAVAAIRWVLRIPYPGVGE